MQAKGLTSCTIGVLAGLSLAASPCHAQDTPDPQSDKPIVADSDFEDALPPLSDDLNAPLEPMVPALPAPQAPPVQPDAPEIAAPEALPAEIAQPLPGLAQFDAEPLVEVAAPDDENVEIRYDYAVRGLDVVGLENAFEEFSALEKGDGKAANATMVAARAREDELLAVRLMQSRGYYDATATSVLEQGAGRDGRLRAVINAVPGERYRLGEVRVAHDPVVPPGLVRDALPLTTGEPIDADRVQGAEANVSLQLVQNGYPFAEVGQRDILLDEVTLTGDYTLPVDTGPRSTFGGFVSRRALLPGEPRSRERVGAGPGPGEEGADAATRARRRVPDVFDAEHLALLARFEPGELYDSRKVDDLRQALVATGLFRTVSVEPQRTGRPGPDGTEQVDLLVRQRAGPARTISAEGGYGTGQGLRIEGAWTHRNLFPPEGALIARAVAGTQEQGASVTFRRSNAGRRDRTFQATVSANRSNYNAFEAFTGGIAARWSYDSTPIWQKRFTYAYGFELIGTNEDNFDLARSVPDRGTYFIAALPLFAGFDTSDDLLDPTRGFRLNATVRPETSVRGAFRPYVATILEGTAYYPVRDDLVIAGRVRVGSIQGVERNDLAPSRRLYSGGGGSVRGFGFQELGPRVEIIEIDEETGEPSSTFRYIGGRSLNEFALEARYRFGNFGIVPFIDAGQAYTGTLPEFSDIRFGVGVGARYYTNFGPLRIDVATPINRRPGESTLTLYLSIGQAF